jgi:hypothetical protein
MCESISRPKDRLPTGALPRLRPPRYLISSPRAQQRISVPVRPVPEPQRLPYGSRQMWAVSQLSPAVQLAAGLLQRRGDARPLGPAGTRSSRGVIHPTRQVPIWSRRGRGVL